MIAHHRLQRRHAGHDALGAATVAGKKMRLNEAGDDAQIRLHGVTMDERGRAVVGGAQLHVRLAVEGFGVDYAVFVDDFASEHLLHLRARIGPVCAELVEQQNIFGWHVGQVLEQPRDDAIVGRGAGEVSKQNADFGVRLDQLLERFLADWISQRRQQRGTFIR